MRTTPKTTWMMALFLLGLFFVSACDDSDSDDDDDDDGGQTGTLIFTLNAEDFVRDGFVSEDNWQINFEHVYINIQGPTAFQVEQDLTEAKLRAAKLVHAGHPHADIPDGSANEALLGEFFIDGTQGPEPIELGRVENAPIGNYNYMNFMIQPATAESDGLVSDYEGYSIVMIGTATNNDDNTVINFTISLDEEMEYTSCGPHPESIGVVAEGGEGTAEATFHFDHIFGDYEEGPADTDDEEAINYIAIGFGPFATLATDGTLNVTQADLEVLDEYDAFMEALLTLGHYGEAHCNCNAGSDD